MIVHALREPASHRVAVALLAGLSVGAQGVERTHFEQPREKILEQIRTVGVMPVEVAELIPDRETVRDRYEAQLTERLQRAGFNVVPPSEMRTIRDSLKQILGGLHDPMTGAPIAEKLEAYRQFADNEYDARHKVDAYVSATVRTTSAWHTSGYAHWDGAVESSSGESLARRFLKAGGGNPEGYTPAVSLVVDFVDAQRRPLYTGRGGIALLQYIRVPFNPFGRSIIPIDRASLMSNPLRDARAWSLALDPLLVGPRGPRSWTAKRIPPLPDAPVLTVAALRVSRDDLLANHARIAIAPLSVAEVEQRDEVRARYRQLLQTQLTSLGFTVLGGDDFDELWRQRESAAGGFYDPMTGRSRDAEVAEARGEVTAQLVERHGISAVLYPSIEHREAECSCGLARWDGAAETTIFGADTTPGVSPAGALSLRVRIADTSDRTLYEDFGGLQLTLQTAGGRFVSRESALHSDPRKDELAVSLALKALAPTAKKGS